MGAGRSITTHGRSDPDSRRPSISALPERPFDASDRDADRELVDAVLGGDREAFRGLVDRESAQLVRTCHRILGDLHDAEDAAQEAFVTAYGSLASWRADGPFGAWLTRIAVRVALRQASRRRTVAWRDPLGEPGRADRGPVELAVDQASIAAAPANDPIMLTLDAERASAVRAAVTSLSEPYREIVILRFFGGLSLDEIARQTDRPLGTVKTHLRRGLLRLRDSMAEGGHP